MERALHLHLPGLLGPLPEDAVGLVQTGGHGESLAQMLSRGRQARVRADTPDERRLCLFGLPIPEAGDMPVGPLSALGDGMDPGDDWIFRADPVHLRPDRDRLLVMDPGRLALPGELVEELVRDFNGLFTEDGMTLEAPRPDAWYLRVREAPALETFPLDRVIGRPMGECLPRGTDARRWITHLNAMQMLLHGSALNRHREAEGRLAINGLWPWGGGYLPAMPGTSSWGLVCTDVALVRGLARHAAVPSTSVLEPDDLLEQPVTERTGAVLVDAGAFPAVRDGDSFRDWESALNGFLQDWAQPLLDALRAGRLGRMVLDTGDRCWELTPGALRHFWRRRRPLEYWLERGGS